MLQLARAALFLLPAAALLAVGCTPPVGSGSQSDPAGVTAPAGVTTSELVAVELAAADQSGGGTAGPDETATTTTVDKKKEKEVVLYDSGYEEDNESCMVCHIDFKNEELSSVHLEAGITCAACHGDSEVHRADEYNIIRPDVTWGRAETEPFCKQCHEKHKHPKKVEEFRQKWLDKRRPNGRWVLGDSVCTDCHGKHAVAREEGTFK